MVRAALDSKVLSSVRIDGQQPRRPPEHRSVPRHCKIWMYEGITIAYAGQPAVKETGRQNSEKLNAVRKGEWPFGGLTFPFHNPIIQ
jgi:hypothetical protein